MERDQQFQKHLLETFRLEAEEHLSGITSALIELEKGGDAERQAQLVELVFREAHSLKGAARSVGRSDLESLCQSMEGLFSSMKRGEVKPGPDLLDLLQRGADLLARLLPAEGALSDEERGAQREMVKRLSAAAKGEGAGAPRGEGVAGAGPAGRQKGGAEPLPEPRQQEETAYRPPQEPRPLQPPQEERTPEIAPGPRPQQQSDAEPLPERPQEPPQEPKGEEPSREAKRGASHPNGRGRHDLRGTMTGGAETVRVSWSKLSAVLLLSEEMLSAKLSARQRALQMKAARNAFAEWRKQWGRVLPEVQRLAGAGGAHPGSEGGIADSKEIGRVLEFLSWNSSFIKSLEARYGAQAKDAEHESRSLGGMVDNLLADVKKAMMFPFSSLLEPFPKIVRDLARDSGKEAELVIHGEEIEIDRRILEEMKDPLIHLVRNSVDHGIEKPEQREARGKPRRGIIAINIAPRDDKAEIVVADDGAGIVPSLVREALYKLNLLSAEKGRTLSDSELLPFVFQSGLSTSPIITEVSGHGLGLAIVKEKVEKLGGTVTLQSVPERGTTFTILVPLSVATFRGILVRVDERLFVFPATHVERAVRLKGGEVGRVQNRESLTLDGKVLSLERLAAVLELPTPGRDPVQMQAVVVTAGGESLALLVDEVLGEQEVLLKSLGPQLARVRNIAGATVLGSGKVAPILNVPDLLKSATQLGAAAPSLPPPAEEAGGAPRPRVLVVEDSITSRTLLKNILESGGYQVSTAIDGIDAFAKLKGGDFDIVVSDVEMPRMDGFELTAKIRQEPELRDLPVVLVTALESREDRERGVDVGANAYIVKSSFDQSNLLEVVKRLV